MFSTTADLCITMSMSVTKSELERSFKRQEMRRDDKSVSKISAMANFDLKPRTAEHRLTLADVDQRWSTMADY